MHFFATGLFPFTVSLSVSIEKAAKEFIREGMMDDGLLNRVWTAFRPYDPCPGCAASELNRSQGNFKRIG
jgi:coenzyme F420-reducing hydrogenase alpha subunit